MALKRPPNHRVNATPVLIINDDPAWDQERIAKDVAEATAENERRKEDEETPGDADQIDIGEHPYFRYQRGETRFDLDAQTPWRGTPLSASDYLLPGEEATRFVLRRLRWNDYHRVLSLAGQGNEAKLCACRIGLVRVEGCPDLRIDKDATYRSDDEMQQLHDLEPRLALLIGSAVWEASQPLRESEKKR